MASSKMVNLILKFVGCPRLLGRAFLNLTTYILTPKLFPGLFYGNLLKRSQISKFLNLMWLFINFLWDFIDLVD